MKRKLTVEIITYLFIFLFVYAATNKLVDIQKFRVEIGQSPLLINIAGFVVWFVPIIELLVAVLLVIPRFRFAGLYASFGLMMMFTAYIIAILSFSQKIPCSCGGILSSMGWKEHLVFNGAFVFLGLLAIVLQQGINTEKGLLNDVKYNNQTS